MEPIDFLVSCIIVISDDMWDTCNPPAVVERWCFVDRRVTVWGLLFAFQKANFDLVSSVKGEAKCAICAICAKYAKQMPSKRQAIAEQDRV